MKNIELIRKLLLVVSLLVTLNNNAQTFSNSTAAAHDSWNSSNSWATAFSRSIVVSGLSNPLSTTGTVLKQINLTLGNGVNTGLNLSTYAMRIKSPSGTIINICAAGGFAATSITNVDIKYRDDALLLAPSASTQQPYNIGYYRVATSNSFSNVNGENPNGTWTLEIIENTITEIAFSKVELVFGSVYNYQDITATTTNDACSVPQCITTGTILKATINGYTSNANDPNVTSPYPGGCQWNAAKNNSAWFYFTANSTTAQITISGISAPIQTLVVNSTNQCVAGSQSVPTGGCPTDAVNDTYTSPRYTGTSGSSNNQQFNLSSLTPGNVYALVVDGTGGAISPLYIEMSGSTGSCAIPLPIELYSISGINYCNNNVITWRTASESNNDYFLIEESIDGELFVKVDSIDAIGNSTNHSTYSSSISINGNSPIYYYKLSQVDIDGQIVETKIISIKNTCNSDNIKYKNDQLILEGYENIQSVEIFDLQGRKVLEGTTEVINVIDLSNSIYNVIVKANGEYFSKKIYKL